MGQELSDNGKRQIAIRHLEAKGYVVTPVGSGQGVPKNSRLMLKKDGKSFACVVKTTTGGRISFQKDEDDNFKAMDGVDFVLHVRPAIEREDAVLISMFRRGDVLDAFNKNVKALHARNRGHIPSWINPHYEDGWRLTGSGFIDKALWSEVVPISEVQTSSATTLAVDTEKPIPLSIMEAKVRLAASFGVSPESIEITIRG